jgi:putative ABC transport system ATP-binding protein
MIKLKNISKKFAYGKSSKEALSNISIQIKKGEFIAIVGHSGSGKTTLLNIIGGLDSPTKGEIMFNKKNLNKLSDDKLSGYRSKEIGFIFQEFHLEPNLTVKGNILLPTHFNKKIKDKDALAEKLIKEVKLSKQLNSKASELSGGEKQRTAIARALINNPKIIIADEPTGNLDAETGETIIDLLKNLQKNHDITLIIATHDLKIAKAANRIIKISEGKIVK